MKTKIGKVQRNCPLKVGLYIYLEKSRKKLHAVCSRLVNRKNPLIIADIKAIKEYVNKEFNPDNHCGLCNGCYFLLNKKYNVRVTVIKIDQIYKPEGRPKFLRSTGPN